MKTNSSRSVAIAVYWMPLFCREQDLRTLWKRVLPFGGTVPASIAEFELALLLVAKRKRVSALKVFEEVACAQAPVFQSSGSPKKVVSPGGSAFTKRDMLPKVKCQIPPGSEPQWSWIPEIRYLKGRKCRGCRAAVSKMNEKDSFAPKLRL